MDTKNCRYCGSEILKEAKICPTCKYHQKPWRNQLVFFAGIAGFITILASGFAFIVDRTADAYRNLTWKDEIRVVSFRTALWPDFSLVVSNAGSGPVFASDIILNWRGGNASFNVNQRINAGDFLKLGDNLSVPGRGYDAYVSSSSGLVRPQVLREAGLDDAATPNKSCFLTVYHLSNGTDIERMKDYYASIGQKLVAEEAAARIAFFSLHSKEKLMSEFPVLVAFVRSATDRCREISVE